MSVRIPEGSPYYHMAFMIDRKRYSRSCKTADRRKAQRMEDEWKAALREQTARHPLVTQLDCTFDQAAELYWQEQGKDTRDSRSLETEIERVVAMVGPEVMCSAINLGTERRIRASLRNGERPPGIGKRGRPLKAGTRYDVKTINDYLDLISRILTHAEGSLPTVFPFKPRGKRNGETPRNAREVERPRYRYMSTLEQRAFRQVSEFNLLQMVEFDIETGMRSSALCAARWHDIDWTKKTITFNLKAKGEPPLMHTVDLSEEALEILYHRKLNDPHPEFIFTLPSERDFWHRKRKISKGDPIPVSSALLYRRFKRTCVAAGIDAMIVHDLRRTGARLIYDDFDIEAARAFLGHSDIKQTQNYLGLKATDLKPLLSRRSSRAKADHAEFDRAERSRGKSDTRAKVLRVVLAERGALMKERKAGRKR